MIIEKEKEEHFSSAFFRCKTIHPSKHTCCSYNCLKLKQFTNFTLYLLINVFVIP